MRRSPIYLNTVSPTGEETPDTPGKPVIQIPSLQFAAELPTLKQAVELLIEEALRRSTGNQSAAARLLGISQQAMSKRLKNRRK